MSQEESQEDLFVFVTANGRVMARRSDGSVADVTEWCELLPRHVCKDRKSDKSTHTPALAA